MSAGSENGSSEKKQKLSVSDLVNGDGSFSFEDEWEEDDLMAISGKPGLGFQKVFTRNNDYKTSNAHDHLSDNFEKISLNQDLSESDLDKLPIPEEISTTDNLDSSCSTPQVTVGIELEWDNDTPVHNKSNETSPVHSIPSMWRTIVIGGKNYKLDMSAVNPYRQVLSHGGYYGEGLNAIVVFSACYLPDAKIKNYQYVMDNLFLYIVSTLDLLVAEDYMIIFFNGGCRRKNFPPLKWLKKCYQMIHQRLRKNLKDFVIVHPTWYVRFIITFFKPFISSKFSRKLRMVPSLHRLADVVSLEGVTIPEAVQQYDVKLLMLGKSELDSSSDDNSDIAQSQNSATADTQNPNT